MIYKCKCSITTFALIGGAFHWCFCIISSVVFYGKKAVQNPWKSNTLEWTTPVEHIHGNWQRNVAHDSNP
jgi:cytochrome c oxidase subunit 1